MLVYQTQSQNSSCHCWTCFDADFLIKHTQFTQLIDSEVTFYHIPLYSWHILSLFSNSIPPSLPAPTLLLTFGPEPEWGSFPHHIPAQWNSHELCLAGTHPSSSLKLLLPTESWPMPGPSSPSCWININIHHLAPALSESHNEEFTKQCFIYESHWREWTRAVHLLLRCFFFLWLGNNSVNFITPYHYIKQIKIKVKRKQQTN